MSKVIFKINGERNSGTGFLWKLLMANYPNYKLSHEVCNGITDLPQKVNVGWKHGDPTYLKEYKKRFPDYKIINIFIVREINPWLISFFKNPYHVVTAKDFKTYLTKPLIVKNGKGITDFKTGKVFNYADQGKNVLELRKHKLSNYKEFFDNEEYVVITPMSYLQNNTKDFLNNITKHYNLDMIDDPIININHTKTKGSVKNRVYNIKINKVEQKIIDDNTDIELENFFKEFKIK